MMSTEAKGPLQSLGFASTKQDRDNQELAHHVDEALGLDADSGEGHIQNASFVSQEFGGEEGGNSFEEEFVLGDENSSDVDMNARLHSVLSARTAPSPSVSSVPPTSFALTIPAPVSASISLAGSGTSSRKGSSGSISSLPTPAGGTTGNGTALEPASHVAATGSTPTPARITSSSSPSMQMMMSTASSGSSTAPTSGGHQKHAGAAGGKAVPLGTSPLRRSYDATTAPTITVASYSPSLAMLEESRPKSPVKVSGPTSLAGVGFAGQNVAQTIQRSSIPTPTSLLLRDLSPSLSSSSASNGSSISVLSQDALANMSRFDIDPSNRRFGDLNVSDAVHRPMAKHIDFAPGHNIVPGTHVGAGQPQSFAVPSPAAEMSTSQQAHELVNESLV